MVLICQNCRAEFKLDSDYGEIFCPKCYCTAFIQDNDTCEVSLKPFIEQYADEKIFTKLSFAEKVNFIAKKLEEDMFTVDIPKIHHALKTFGFVE